MTEPRLVLITQGLSSLVEPLASSSNIVGILECPPRSKGRGFVFRTLSSIRSFVSVFFGAGLAGFCRWKKIPYLMMQKNETESLLAWLKDKAPDLVIVYSMSWLLGKDVLDIPKYGTINLHPSALPSYRGPNPLYWMYRDNCRRGGVTLHFLDEGEDTGDIIYQDYYDIDNGMTMDRILKEAIGNVGLRLVLRAIADYRNLPRSAQPVESPTKRARNLRAGEAKVAVDWENWSVDRVWHFFMGIQDTVDDLGLSFRLLPGFYWKVDSFDRNPAYGLSNGKTAWTADGLVLGCHGGRIFLKCGFSLKKMLKALFR